MKNRNKVERISVAKPVRENMETARESVRIDVRRIEKRTMDGDYGETGDGNGSDGGGSGSGNDYGGGD